jgi:quinoprotein glucose dehydrogenase
MTLCRKTLIFPAMPLLIVIAAWVLLSAVHAAESGTGTSTPLNDPVRAMEQFRLPAGFKAELFASEPLLANPVAFTIDHQGNFYIAETHRHSAVGPAFRYYEGVLDIRSHLDWLDEDLALQSVPERTQLIAQKLGTNVVKMTQKSEILRLVQDKNGDGVAESSTVFASGFNKIPDGIAAGVLARDGKVWFSNIPDLWLLEDTNSDGKADKREALHTGYGVHIAFLGHDLHGLTRGVDGRLYFSIGDRGLNVTNKEGQVLFYPDEGTVLRCELDGSKLELFARGLRNPQELAFDDFGNLFTGDNNSDAIGPAGFTSSKEATAAGASAISTCTRRRAAAHGTRRSSGIRNGMVRRLTSFLPWQILATAPPVWRTIQELACLKNTTATSFSAISAAAPAAASIPSH